MKAFATDAIFVIVVIGLLVSAGLIIFWKWLDMQNMQANQISCKLKQQAYCNDWINGKKWNWDDKEPKNCDKFNIYPPASEEECKKLFGL
jgi:hypothetical protein